MEDENLSVKEANETSENSCIWTKLKLLYLIVIQSRLGQIILRLLEHFLWIVEKCAEWSLPSEEAFEDENGKMEKLELVRPLPWILFLPSLAILRMIRISVNVIILLLGFSVITASDMVRIIQKTRRYLNALKTSGTKGRNCSKDKRSSINEAKQALIRSIRLTLSSLSCLDGKPSLSPPPTKIHVNSALDFDAATTIFEEKSVTESMDSIKRESSTDSSESEQDEEKQKTLQEQLDQLTSSDSDSEYICLSGEGRDNSSIYPDPDTSVSSNELNDIIQDAKEWREAQGEKQQQLDELTSSQQLQDAERAAVSAEQVVSEEKSPAKESRDEVEKRHLSSRRTDSPECHTSDRSSQEGDPIFYSPISSDSDTPKECSKPPRAIEIPISRDSLKTAEFINGEIRFSSAYAISESQSSEKANNGVVVEKRGANANKCHKGKRTSHGNRRKK